MEIAITRENNQYNKYMKWHLTVIHSNGGKYSDWFKTEREAIAMKERCENKADYNAIYPNSGR